MSSSSEGSDRVVHVFRPLGNASAAGPEGTDSKDMHPQSVLNPATSCNTSSGGGAASPPLSSHQGAGSSSQQYTVEEQITTVRIPMRRPSASFLEILREAGARGEVFTMKEIIHHVKNYIIKHQLFDPYDPRVVHCGSDKLGQVFQVDKFTINEAVPLFVKNSCQLPDSCIHIHRQLVKKAVDAHRVPSSTMSSLSESNPRVTSTVTSTTGGGAVGVSVRRHGEEGGASSHQQTSPRSVDGERVPENRRTSMNIEYGDEVDGATPMFQVNLETSGQHSQLPLGQSPEEDSFSVQYDSDHFAVEYELEPSDHRSDSEHSMPDSTKQDYLVMEKESDVEFWADYSDTETSSDAELGVADQWQCETCGTRNVPFYRNCGKCWALRPHWLPESSCLPSSSTNSLPQPLPAEPSGIHHGYNAVSSESNDEQPQSSQGSLRYWRLGDRVRRRRVRVVSASSSDRNSESLVSLSEDDLPTSSSRGENCGEVRSDATLPSSQGLPSSQETAEGEGRIGGSQESQPGGSSQDSRERGGGKWGRGIRAEVAPLADMCVVCASRPKTGSIIHGSSGHQVCCYRCAKRLRRKGLPCPVCRRTIQKVIKNFVL